MRREFEIEGFWQSFISSLSMQANLPASYQVWCFGNNKDMADELGFLAKAGIKTATCSLLWEHELGGEKTPEVGQFNLVTDWDGHPICVLETTWVAILRFDEVDGDFAFDEGEGDRSLSYWQEAHWRYFSKICASIGRQPSLSMPLICERFRLLYS
jgi:uncharacterized protein YhfF